MILDFLFKKKQQGTAAEDAAPKEQNAKENSSSPAAEKKKKESIEERIDREMESLPSFVKNKIKDPQMKQKFVELAKRMEADGVDMNSPRAMKKWVKENEKKLKEEQAGHVETVVKQPEPGRNEPCPCGSGKKYKKCCGK